MTDLEIEERELRMAQLRADIRTKDMDTEYKRKLSDWEPWKVVVTSLGAGAALMVAGTALAAFLLSQLR